MRTPCILPIICFATHARLDRSSVRQEIDAFKAAALDAVNEILELETVPIFTQNVHYLEAAEEKSIHAHATSPYELQTTCHSCFITPWSRPEWTCSFGCEKSAMECPGSLRSRPNISPWILWLVQDTRISMSETFPGCWHPNPSPRSSRS